ncbi:saccharopine dehydrogenase family protein [Thermodesulfovibrio hydrogeniphilus]
MKIAVVGIGAVGFFICKYFLNKTDFYIKAIDKSTKNLSRLKEALSTNRLSLNRISINDGKSFGKIISDVDLIINSATPALNRKLLELALRYSVNYQDLASELEDPIFSEQLEYDEKFRQKGILGLINTGVSPGLTNLIAGELACRFESLSSIKIRMFEDQQPPGTIWSWSPRILLSDIISAPVIFENGKFKQVEPFSNLEYYHYLEPIGWRRAYHVLGEEVATIPRFIKVKNVDIKAGGSDIEFMMALYNMGLLSEKQLRINGTLVSPYEVLKKIISKVSSLRELVKKVKEGVLEEAILGIVVEGRGKIKEKRKIIRGYLISPSIKELNRMAPGTTHVSYSTALVACIMAKFIRKIHTECNGIIPPEAIPKKIRRKIFSELSKEGFKVIFEEVHQRSIRKAF